MAHCVCLNPVPSNDILILGLDGAIMSQHIPAYHKTWSKVSLDLNLMLSLLFL
jgi:hypothetical protein